MFCNFGYSSHTSDLNIGNESVLNLASSCIRTQFNQIFVIHGIKSFWFFFYFRFSAIGFRKCFLAKLKQHILFFFWYVWLFLCSAPTYPKFGKPMPNHSILHLLSQFGWYGFINLGFGQKRIVAQVHSFCFFRFFLYKTQLWLITKSTEIISSYLTAQFNGLKLIQNSVSN